MDTSDATPETWLPVPGHVGYEVSDHGRVRSVDREVVRSDGRRYWYTGVVLRPAASGKDPHLRVALYRDGKSKTRLVHQLVLEAFVGPRPEGQWCRHGPGGALDNRWPENLCYGSAVENAADKERDGTALRGETSTGAKLTEAIVLECRRRHAAGELQKSLAAEFGVGVSCMSCAVRGITWGWLPDAVPSAYSPFARRTAKFTPETLAEAIRRCAAGESRVALAAEFGVTKDGLHKAIQRRAS